MEGADGERMGSKWIGWEGDGEGRMGQGKGREGCLYQVLKLL